MPLRRIIPFGRRLIGDGSSKLTGYAVVVLSWIAAAIVAWLLRPWVPETALGLLFIPVICGVSVQWGLRFGLFAAALGVLTLYFLNAPGAHATLMLFAAVAIATAFGGDWIFKQKADGLKSAQALAEREAHLHSIYDTAPDALIVIDERGIIQSYSAAAERVFQWRASEALGRNVKMLMPQPYQEEHDRYVGNYLRTGERRIIGVGRIVVGERKDGSTFPLELAVGEVRSERGRVFTGFIRDLTERQATEARLQELQSELVHMSRFTAMGEMASAIAHEINQPLSAIANYLSGGRRILERGPAVDPLVTEALEKAGAQALRAGEIIRRLRDFLARREGERAVEPLARLVQEACALALVGAKEDGVRVRYQFDPQVDSVLVDRVQVQQVVVNLVRNALDAMQTVKMRGLLISSAPADPGMARISVADTGPGLDEAAAARLFEPFVTTKPQGMGVGLSISRTIVEAHGGHIWTEPNPGGGAIFHFTVRLADADANGEQHDA
ncbi:MAG: PAS domain S-box protein [Hyphomonadaceae bacterium]|nr:PAS domain S-box protein [Hyphomonadaceae bacterium]